MPLYEVKDCDTAYAAYCAEVHDNADLETEHVARASLEFDQEAFAEMVRQDLEGRS